MSRLLFLLSVLLAAVVMPLAAQGWTLVWSDEFDRDGRPDTTVWNFEHGFVRNHEAQWYQSENAYQHGGSLIIEARREHRPNPTFRDGARHWGQQRPTIDFTSACLTTRGNFHFRYGRMEVRARIPVTGGSWPAIWTLGEAMEWPSCGEIDVMEFYRINGVPHILANAAWGSDRRYHAVWNTKRIPFAHFTERDADWASHFHIWRMDWDETAIRIYLDDELLNEIPLAATINGTVSHDSHNANGSASVNPNMNVTASATDGANPFRQPHYILLNLALGGDNGGIIDTAAFPLRYEIDYVRVYQRP